MRHFVAAMTAAFLVLLTAAAGAQTAPTVGGPAMDQERMQQMMKMMGDMQEQMKGMREQMKGMHEQMKGMAPMMGQMGQMQGMMQQHREQMMKQCPMGASRETPK